MNHEFIRQHRGALAGIVVITIALVVRFVFDPPTVPPTTLPPEHASQPPSDYIKGYIANENDIIRTGDVLTSAGLESNYYVSTEMKRLVFPNQATMQTWYPVVEFDIKNIDRKKLESYPLSGNVTVRPGMRILTFQSDPTYYVVSHGGVLRQASPSILKKLYGEHWNNRVDTLEEYYRTNYTVSDPLRSSNEYSPIDEYNSSPTISVDRGVFTPLKSLKTPSMP